MRAWSDAAGERIEVARRMYALRLGEVLPRRDLNALRGIEGARMKRTYRLLAERYGIDWQGRRYDRNNPLAADIPNQAINHASVAVTASAAIALANHQHGARVQAPRQSQIEEPIVAGAR